MTVGIAAGPSVCSAGFAPRHRADRDVFLLLLGAVWIAVLAGFGLDVANHFKVHEPPYPLITHLHAVTATGWMGLLTAQVLLVRSGNVALHRKIGMSAVAIIPVMVVLGLAAAWNVQREYFYTPDSEPNFLAVNITDMVLFGGVASAALMLRADAASHKRLFLMTALFLSHTGFARWIGLTLGHPFGQGFWPFMLQNYLGCDVLIGALGAYDLATRGRLNGPYAAATGLTLATELFATWLYWRPAWRAAATHLIGH